MKPDHDFSLDPNPKEIEQAMEEVKNNRQRLWDEAVREREEKNKLKKEKKSSKKVK